MDYVVDLTSKWNATTLLAAEVFAIVFTTLLIDFFQKLFIRRIARRIDASKQIWDDALLFAARPTLTALIWIVGISVAADVLGERTGATVFALATPLREVGIIASITWFVLRLVSAVEHNLLAQRPHLDRTTVDAIAKLTRASVVITAVLVIMQTFGFSISGVLAFGGIGGIAVGFAAKDLLANFFGGLMLYLDRPFSVGDWIRSPDREIEGTVEQIGWRLTTIRTFDKRPLYVPNSAFTQIAVENPSRMSHRRIKETIGVRYDDVEQIPQIIAAVKQMLVEHPDIDATQTMIVNLNSFAPSSLDFFIYTFTRTTNWIEYHEVKQDVLLKVAAIIAAHGAEIAYPTSTVHLADSSAKLNSESLVNA